MSKRKLKRQLSLGQVVMLGTAGTIGAQIFVLTGHAAGMVGPAAVLALLIGGLLSYSVALNYCELATAYPVTGGAMSYVREAYGTGLLSYLVGTMDCLSSTFYAALSAVGFAYSLQLLIPSLPLVPTAVASRADSLWGSTFSGSPRSATCRSSWAQSCWPASESTSRRASSAPEASVGRPFGAGRSILADRSPSVGLYAHPRHDRPDVHLLCRLRGDRRRCGRGQQTPVAISRAEFSISLTVTMMVYVAVAWSRWASCPGRSSPARRRR